jgi:hypothetical protein
MGNTLRNTHISIWRIFAVTQNTAFGVMISKYKEGKFVLFLNIECSKNNLK